MGGDQEMVTTDQQVLGRATVAQRWLARLGFVAAVGAVLGPGWWPGPSTVTVQGPQAVLVSNNQSMGWATSPGWGAGPGWTRGTLGMFAVTVAKARPRRPGCCAGAARGG